MFAAGGAMAQKNASSIALKSTYKKNTFLEIVIVVFKAAIKSYPCTKFCTEAADRRVYPKDGCSH